MSQEIANKTTCEIGGARLQGKFLTMTFLIGEKLQEEVINSVYMTCFLTAAFC